MYIYICVYINSYLYKVYIYLPPKLTQIHIYICIYIYDFLIDKIKEGDEFVITLYLKYNILLTTKKTKIEKNPQLVLIDKRRFKPG